MSGTLCHGANLNINIFRGRTRKEDTMADGDLSLSLWIHRTLCLQHPTLDFISSNIFYDFCMYMILDSLKESEACFLCLIKYIASVVQTLIHDARRLGSGVSSSHTLSLQFVKKFLL